MRARGAYRGCRGRRFFFRKKQWWRKRKFEDEFVIIGEIVEENKSPITTLPQLSREYPNLPPPSPKGEIVLPQNSDVLSPIFPEPPKKIPVADIVKQIVLAVAGTIGYVFEYVSALLIGLLVFLLEHANIVFILGVWGYLIYKWFTF